MWWIAWKWDVFYFGFISKAFKQYPDTLEEIDEMIHDEKARIECQYQSNPQVHVHAMELLSKHFIIMVPLLINDQHLLSAYSNSI